MEKAEFTKDLETAYKVYEAKHTLKELRTALQQYEDALDQLKDREDKDTEAARELITAGTTQAEAFTERVNDARAALLFIQTIN